jgi:hypothetical protein
VGGFLRWVQLGLSQCITRFGLLPSRLPEWDEWAVLASEVAVLGLAAFALFLMLCPESALATVA